jgi:O-antigen/teichoic acid export membrane protein
VTEAAVPWRSTRRFATVFGTALVAGQLGQLAWLAIGSRTMSGAAFGTVLAAQALYAVLQLVVEAAATFHGARLAAAETLDEQTRSDVIGLRLRLALGGVAVMVVVGAAGGIESALALTPYAAALALFALFTHWESFGRGSSGPWSTYLVLRGIGLAVVSGCFLATDAVFPLVGAGLLECAAIVSASAAFGFRPLRDLRAGLRARRPPWRSALAIGLPSVVWQLGLASGTVLLGAAGAPAQAAHLGVSVRLLTGVNQLGGVLAAALFPRLAAARSRAMTSADDVAIGAVVGFACALGLAASALILLCADVVVKLFLDHSDPISETTAALVLAAAPATTLLVVLSMILTARRLEAAFFAPFLIGTAVVVAASAAVVVADPGSPAEWIAGAFTAGQLLTFVLLRPRAAAAMPFVRPIRVVGLTTVPAALLAASAALVPELRPEAALVELGLAALLALASLSDVRARLRHAV